MYIMCLGEGIMSEKTKIFGTAALSALLVLAAGAPLLYYGLPTIIEKARDPSVGTSSTTIKLTPEIIEEIQTAANRSKEELQLNLSESEGRQSAILAELQKAVVGIHAQQEDIVAKLEKLSTQEQETVPGKRQDTYNQTIFFPMGKVSGPTIDSQIQAAILELRDRIDDQNCSANVLGFSDTLGGDMANLKLSEDRASYVAEELKSNGINLDKVKGWGERWLNVHTPDATKNDKNRRVVIELGCNNVDPVNLTSTSS
jgi:outer membrane protein OmpA-like peptidoglycan-associated protein